MERLVCDYSAVYDPPGGGYYGCGLTLYEPPDGTCESNVDAYFTSSSCGWPAGINCSTVNCDISRSSSVESCNDGEPGCREVEHVVDQPPATVNGSVTCGVPGSGGWCRGEGELSLSGSEPLSGYTILALEGTRNGEPFACSGSACDVPLLEGANDFSFWAISSWGDTSLMDSAGALLDTQDPSLAGSASGTPGDHGWYVSNVTVEASASDASPGSGLASLDVRIDGGGWAGYSGPFTIGEGSHDVELRAVDGAGNSETQSLDIDIDTQSPIADLDASPSFCPGCGQSLDITVVAQDGGSGIAAWSLVASGRNVASGGGDIGQTISWDGGGLGGGTHTLELEARDEAGNTAGASFDFALVAPTPGPHDDSSDDTGAGSSLGSPTPTVSPTSTRTPRVTPTAWTVNFGPSTSLGAGLPAAPADDSAGDSIANLQSPISDGPSGSAGAVLPPSGVVFGGAALALAGVATAIALETTRRRKKEEEQARLDMERKNAEAEAREAAQRAALAQARSDAEFNLILGQIWDQATTKRGPSTAWLAGAAATAEAARRAKDAADARMARKEAMLEPHIPPETAAKPPKVPPQPRSDIELIRSQNWAGYAPAAAQSADIPWWERLLNAAIGLGKGAVGTVTALGSVALRYGVPAHVTALVGSTTYQWAQNLSSPDAFQTARERSRAEVALLLETYPDFLEPREIRQQSVEGHPYLQITRAMDGLDALAEVAATYIDAAVQQHPLVRLGVPLLQDAADWGCPRWNETLGRICGSGVYLGAGLLEQPADTALGTLNGFVIQPAEGIAKLFGFAVENNAFAVGAEAIEAGGESGVNGVIDTVGNYLHRLSAMTADGDVQSGLIAAALLGLAFIAPAAAFVFVASSTLDSLGGIARQVLGAPTWEKAMEIAGGREARTLAVALAILIALGSAKGVKDWVQWERTRTGVAPEVAAALERLPLSERATAAEAASGLGMGHTELAAYSETASRMPGSIRSVFDQLSQLERLRLFSEAVRSTSGTNQPVSLETLASGFEEASYVRTEAFIAADLLNRIGVESSLAPGLLEWLAQRSTNVSSNGAADRVVIGRFFEDGQGWGYTQEARANGGTTFQVPDGLWDRLPRPLQEALNKEFIRQQMRAGVERFDLVGGTVADILENRSTSLTAVEIDVLAKEGPAYGYRRDGNSWVLVER
jgi:hypothetical protein